MKGCNCGGLQLCWGVTVVGCNCSGVETVAGCKLWLVVKCGGVIYKCIMLACLG